MAFYAWSELRYGGKTEERKRADGRMYSVVLERNIVPHGEKVTKKDLGVSDEEWDHLIETGSVRSYPVPEGATENKSPSLAFTESLLNARGDVDVDKLMEMGLANPPAANPPAEEQAELPVGA